jgi:hypothetical protein
LVPLLKIWRLRVVEIRLPVRKPLDRLVPTEPADKLVQEAHVSLLFS